jgi:hypothetical protein
MKGTAFKPEPSVSISVWKNGLQMFLRILPEMLDKKNPLIFLRQKALNMDVLPKNCRRV